MSNQRETEHQTFLHWMKKNQINLKLTNAQVNNGYLPFLISEQNKVDGI